MLHLSGRAVCCGDDGTVGVLSSEPPELSVRTIVAGDECIVELGGEIDLYNPIRVNLEFEPVFSRRPVRPVVRVDCGGVTFMDSVGLAVLLKARRQPSSAGRRLWVSLVSLVIAGLLNVSGLTGLLTRGNGRAGERPRSRR